MAAESVGLAASIAGLLSLGLQVTEGIVKYVDAFDGRQEELEQTKLRNNSLRTIICAIEASLPSLRNQHLECAEAAIQNIQSCKEKLGCVETLRLELTDSTIARPKFGAGTRKRLMYPFHRPKFQQLAQRLQQANDMLKLTLIGLNLEISNINTKKLSAIEQSTRVQAAEVQLLRSETAVTREPIIRIDTQLRDLRSDVSLAADFLAASSGSTTAEIHECHHAVQKNIWQSKELVHSQLLQQKKVLETFLMLLEGSESHVGNIRTQGSGITARADLDSPYHCGYVGKYKSNDARDRRAVGKHAALDVLQNAELRTQVKDRRISNEEAENDPRNHRDSISDISDCISRTGRLCICHRLRRITARKWFQLGHVRLAAEWEMRGHWPSCPLSNAPVVNRCTVGLKYSGITGLMNHAIDISLASTFGATGFNIGPNMACHPTADFDSDPGALIIKLFARASYFIKKKHAELFMTTCLKKLMKLMENKTVRPSAVDGRNRSLMHYTITTMSMWGSTSSKARASWFVELVQLLLLYEVPAFSYDIEGSSPLRRLDLHSLQQNHDVVNILLRANKEDQPAIVAGSPPAGQENAICLSNKPFYEISHGYAEACECGPLSMAIIRDDFLEAVRILNAFPSSLEEVDIYGQTPLHLAATRPRILSLLVEAADVQLLKRLDTTGATALESAMIRSSSMCMNGSTHRRCRNCVCTECVKILFGAGCSPREHGKTSGSCDLFFVFRHASEMARRLYVFQMKLMRYMHTKGTRSKTAGRVSELYGLLRGPQDASENEYGWVYYEIIDPRDADLFYRYGIRPQVSFFLDYLPRQDQICYRGLQPDYLCWLQAHGADLFLSSARVEDKCNLEGEGIQGAHFAFYSVASNVMRQRGCKTSTAFNELSAAVFRRDLTDGCYCHCSAGGCSPFTWMMKSIIPPYQLKESVPHVFGSSMVHYYRTCGLDLIRLTYIAAIRFTTFHALGLTHTCCNAYSLIYSGKGWADSEDIDNINEEQSSLLELYERLVAEFIQEARTCMTDEGCDTSRFIHFWDPYWIRRIEEELQTLENDEISDVDRRAAEEIGVQWDEASACDTENPFNADTIEYWFHELDMIGSE